MDFDASKPWYHGSPLRLDTLRAGSTMTQWRDLARVFSHKPALVCVSDDRTIQHTGTVPGYLYEVAEAVTAEDVQPHPRTTMEPGDEWLTSRDLSLRLIGETAVRDDEYLSEAMVAALLERMKAENQT
jgi:hypothetical protein